MSLVPFTPRRFTDSKLFIHEAEGKKLLIKAFMNDKDASRREMEHHKNKHWSASGFRVPQLVDVEFPEIAEPYIVMDFIQGISLSDYLRDGNLPLAAKLETLEKIFDLNYKRHTVACSEQDSLLVHTDPNTDNIILDGDKIFYIDFEHISRVRDTLTAVAKEVATFARRVVKNLGSVHTREVVELLLNAYNYDQDMMDRIEALTYGRSFQLVHRIKDRLKKRNDGGVVTRYDIADAIHHVRASH